MKNDISGSAGRQVRQQSDNPDERQGLTGIAGFVRVTRESMHSSLLRSLLTGGLFLGHPAAVFSEQFRPLQLIGNQQVATGSRQANSVCATDDGGIAIVGRQLVTKLSGPLNGKALTTSWELTVPGFDFFSVKQLASNNLVCSGYDGSASSVSPRLGIVWLNADGMLLKTTSYGGIPITRSDGLWSADGAYDLQVVSDGDLLITGVTSTNPGNEKQSPAYGNLDGWSLLVSADGQLKWEHAWGGSDYDLLRQGVQTKDGGFAFAGYSQSPRSGNKTTPSSGFDFWLIKTDHDGNAVWDKSISYGNTDWAHTLISATNGDLIIGGSTRQTIDGPMDGTIVRVTQDGVTVWDKTIRLQNDSPFAVISLIELPSGKILVQLRHQSFRNQMHPEILIRCLSADGKDLWQTEYEGFAQFSGAMAVGLGGEIVSISSHSKGGYQCVRYAPESVQNFTTVPELFALPELFRTEGEPLTFSLVGPANIPIHLSRSLDLKEWTRFSTNIISGEDLKVRLPVQPAHQQEFVRASVEE